MSYPTTFKGHLLYLSYCSKRNAVCIELCTTCRCRDSLYYSKDEDDCVQLPSTSMTPSQTSTVRTQSTTVSTTSSSTAKRTPSTFSTKTLPAATSPSGTSSRGTISNGTDSSAPSSTGTVQSGPLSTRMSTKDRIIVMTKRFSATPTKYSTQSFSNKMKQTTALLSGVKEKVSIDATSSTGLIVGICIGVVGIVLCAVMFLCLRRRKKNPGKRMKFSEEDCQVSGLGGIQNTTAESRIPLNSLSERYDTEAAHAPMSTSVFARGMNCPMYNAKLFISETVQNEVYSHEELSQEPIYQELYTGPVYSHSATGDSNNHDKELISNEECESSYYSEVAKSPIYSGIED